jgi:DNA invertase Pin-like site-specific DNA recombinase
MTTAAIYARSSTFEHSSISIDNQISACRKTAATEGLVVDDKFVYIENNTPGISNIRYRRIGRQRLIDAINGKQFDVLFMEDILRATRDIAQAINLMSIVETSGLRIVTSDGLDTAQPNWKILWQIKLMAAGLHVENNAMRVVRGMLGQLERGYQVSMPPFGFKAVRNRTPKGHELGSRWEIDSKEAEVIRAMYSLRQTGKSFTGIATVLNTLGVPNPCAYRSHGVARWRPGTVSRILANKIYKGTYAWNASAQAKIKAVNAGRRLDEREFERPHLQIVSDETWAACNPLKMNASVGVGA